MRMFVAGLLIAAGGISASGIAPATEEGTALEALRTLSTQTYEASREIDEAHRNAPARASAILDSHAVDLRKQIDAFAKAHRIGSNGASVLARKLRSVSMLVGNVERARALGASTVAHALVPESKPVNARSTLTRLDAQHGGRCEAALGLGAGHELDGVLDAGAEVWLHVEASAARAIKVDTAVSALDTEIAVFNACPTPGEAPLSTSDDAFGLAAAALLEPAVRRKAYWLRVRNLGARGEVGIVADETGTISGNINWVGSSFSNWANINALDSSGYYVGGVSQYSAGAYTFAVALGVYYVVASAPGNVTQGWPNVECGSSWPGDCTGSSAQPLTVTASDTITGIDFSLNQGAHIGGRVRDAATGLAIANATIQAFSDSQGSLIWPAIQTDGSGRYVLTGLAAGSYHVQAGSNRYLMQAFDGVDCPTGQSCANNTGTAVVVARQGAFDHADFNLHSAAYLRAIVNAATPTSWNYATITAFDSFGNASPVGIARIGETIELGPLKQGPYRFAALLQDHVPQLYDHVDCATNCISELPAGHVLQVANGVSEPTLTFDLRAMASLSGRVTDSVSGEGLANVWMTLFTTTGSQWGSVNSTDDGTYAIVGVPPGTYLLRATSGDHRDMIYASAPCSDDVYSGISGCQLTAATPIVVGAMDVTGIDLALPMNGGISGYVGESTSGSPTPAWASVALYDSSGAQLRSTQANSLGAYAFVDLPARTYFVQAVANDAFAQIYSNIDCPIVGTFCDPTVGTPIALAQGAQRTGVDFSLIDTHRLVGRVVDAVSGQGVPGAIVDAWDTQGGAHCDDASTDLDGYYAIDDSGTCTSDSRWLSTDAGTSHVDQVFSGIACPNGPAYLGQCSLTGATAVAFPKTPALSRADFSLTRPDPIFANGFEAASVLRSARAKR